MEIICRFAVFLLFPLSIMAQDKSLKIDLKVLKEGKIQVSVTNLTNKTLRLYSHVKAEENHYDYFEIEAYTPDYEHIYGISLMKDRDKSAPVIVELSSQKNFTHIINLDYWVGMYHNQLILKKYGLQTLPQKCGVKIRVKYRNSPCTDCSEYYKAIWTGYVYSDWVAW